MYQCELFGFTTVYDRWWAMSLWFSAITAGMVALWPVSVSAAACCR